MTLAIKGWEGIKSKPPTLWVAATPQKINQTFPHTLLGHRCWCQEGN